MSQNTKVICDRCGKDMKPATQTEAAYLPFPKMVDLCPPCLKEIQEEIMSHKK